MGLEQLKTNAGLKTLDEFLADNSYLKGFQLSQADTTVYQALTTKPGPEFPHLGRWYKHIHGWSGHCERFPGTKGEIGVLADLFKTTAAPAKAAAADDDDDIDLFGSDEDEEAEKVKQERLKQYAEKKAKKPALVAKSSVVLDVKPWDDETDMAELEKCVRSVECDGLKWGASKLVPLAYGIKKLQIISVVEDDKVSIDWLQEEIQNFEDLVQSVDVAAFQKI